MGISKRARNLTVWLGVGFLLSPLGFNCHQRTDQSAAVSKASQADSEDQTVRAMVTEDGAPVESSKVRLSSEVTISMAKASQLGLGQKLASADDVLIPKGTELLALYDNDCRKKHGSPLRFEAEGYQPKEDISLSALTIQADSDACLVRIDENPIRQWIAPSTEASTAAPISALATVNDPRLAEARHITFAKALLSWDWFYSGAGINRDVVVAVIDTGVLHTHPDLVDNIYTNAAGKHGMDFVNTDDDPLDDNGHGTHVAGIMGARANNGIGVTGVMGTRIKIMGVKVLDAAGSGSIAAIVNGIRYAADNGAKVINMSLGGSGASTALRDAMVYAAGLGVVVVIAAGNDAAAMTPAVFYSPSCYSKDVPGAITVGSVDAVTGALSSFSNTGTQYVWIAGPGSNGILSTYTGNAYNAIQGTSMASPAVAGVASLLVAAFQSQGITYAPADIVNLLTDSARPVAGLNATIRGGATVDAERAAKLFYSRYVMAGNGGTEPQ